MSSAAVGERRRTSPASPSALPPKQSSTARLACLPHVDTVPSSEVRVEHDGRSRKSGPAAPCPISIVSFLTVGQKFSGTQTVKISSRADSDQWRVNVTIQGVDLLRGTVLGSMEALDVPKADSPVVTFWRGEIIDNINFFFYTREWGAVADNDLAHWTKFAAFTPLQSQVEKDGGSDIDLSSCRFVFMRWKEKFFVNVGEDCGLTIAGFYYLCLDRETGYISGYYFDPRSEPFQCLQLAAVQEPTGYAFPTYEFC